MARIKGSKNRPKSIAELEIMLAEAKSAGGQIEKLTEEAKKTNPEPEFEIKPKIRQKTERKPFEIERPNSQPLDINSEVIRCGNPKCGKILKDEYGVCPFCGCYLKWD